MVAHGEINGADNIRRETPFVTPLFGWANSSDGCSAYPGHSVHPDSWIPPASDRRMIRSERKPTRPRVGASDDIVLPSAALAWLQSHILYCRVWYDTASKSGELGVGWVSPSAKSEPALHLPPLPETETAVGPMVRPAGHPREHDGGTTASSPRRSGVAVSGYPGNGQAHQTPLRGRIRTRKPEYPRRRGNLASGCGNTGSPTA